MPPNIVVTGPLIKSSDVLMEEFKQKDPKLFEWMEDALQKGEDVVYVSLGSLCNFAKWSFEAMYYALKNVGCRVIWSLRGHHLPEKNPKFWCDKWLP